MNRRTFLYSAAATPLFAQPAPRIPIAFLGATHPHALAKVKTVQDSPDFQLAGVCEDNPAVRALLAKAGVTLRTREQILGDASIPVVAVESAVKDHAADARTALAAGKHVHVEKPPATDMKSLRELLALAAKQRRLLQPGYMWRRHPAFQKALEAGRNGWLGEIFLVRGVIHTLLTPAQRRDIAGFFGGQMFELGGHLIDPLVRLLGAPRKVTPILQRLGSDGLADNTIATFEYPRALGSIASSSLHPAANRHRAFEIFGANGSAVIRPLEPATLQIDLARAAGPYRVNSQTVELPPYTRYTADFVELAQAIRTGAPLPITAEEELNVQQALLNASGMS
jgi:predicted dehydrogenase